MVPDYVTSKVYLMSKHAHLVDAFFAETSSEEVNEALEKLYTMALESDTYNDLTKPQRVNLYTEVRSTKRLIKDLEAQLE